MIFGVFCIVMTIHVFLCYPETAQKSLEEIDELFHGDIPAWKTAHGVKGFEQRVKDMEEGDDMKAAALHESHARDTGDAEKAVPATDAPGGNGARGSDDTRV